MSFNQASLCLHSSGGVYGTNLWTYGPTDDNVASAALGAVSCGYFNEAYNQVPAMRAYDIIFAINGATPVVTMLVVHSIDANGVTVVACAGQESQITPA